MASFARRPFNSPASVRGVLALHFTLWLNSRGLSLLAPLSGMNFTMTYGQYDTVICGKLKSYTRNMVGYILHDPSTAYITYQVRRTHRTHQSKSHPHQ
ncbi:hypothetical protein F4819DRAFT_423784 [Hypoxylon fuscum]|nr:hypothetical protein F4819DRAFT_423784 [Hypoxylon fuscum]